MQVPEVVFGTVFSIVGVVLVVNAGRLATKGKVTQDKAGITFLPRTFYLVQTVLMACGLTVFGVLMVVNNL